MLMIKVLWNSIIIHALILLNVFLKDIQKKPSLVVKMMMITDWERRSYWDIQNHQPMTTIITYFVIPEGGNSHQMLFYCYLGYSYSD